MKSMGIVLFFLYGLYLFIVHLYRVMTGTDYYSMKKKVDDLILTILEQEAEIRMLKNELDKRR